MAPESARKERTDDAGPSTPQLVIVCGHPRSGTSMLRRLLNTHPNVMITMEFHNFLRLGTPSWRYLGGLRGDWWRRNIIHHHRSSPRWRKRLDSGVFVSRYMLGILRRCPRRVSIAGIGRILQELFPRVEVVGDKYPGYVFRLARLANKPGLKCIVIYRDCRDVVSSAIHQAQTTWRGRPWATRLDTPEKVAARWVRAIECQEENASKVLIIRYEELVTDPGPVLARLGEFLAVDPTNFRMGFLHPDSIGKHAGRLTPADLETIESIAGATMRRLGYPEGTAT